MSVVLHALGDQAEQRHPQLRLGAWRNILVPEAGTDVPFTVGSFASTDSLGRETLTVVRAFEVAPGRRRRFDATLVPDGPPGAGRVLDYLRTHQRLAVDDDARERFTVDVAVSNRRFGPLVGSRGWFTCTYPRVVGEAVPLLSRAAAPGAGRGTLAPLSRHQPALALLHPSGGAKSRLLAEMAEASKFLRPCVAHGSPGASAAQRAGRGTGCGYTGGSWPRASGGAPPTAGRRSVAWSPT